MKKKNNKLGFIKILNVHYVKNKVNKKERQATEQEEILADYDSKKCTRTHNI